MVQKIDKLPAALLAKLGHSQILFDENNSSQCFIKRTLGIAVCFEILLDAKKPVMLLLCRLTKKLNMQHVRVVL